MMGPESQTKREDVSLENRDDILPVQFFFKKGMS